MNLESIFFGLFVSMLVTALVLTVYGFYLIQP